MIVQSVQAQHCLKIKNNTDIATGVGNTLNAAIADLEMKMPSIGVLQRLNVEQRKADYNSFYSESRIVKQRIKANFDLVTTQKCMIGNQYAISAYIPKGGISYLSNEEVRAAIGNLASFKERKVCKDNMYTIVIAGNSDIQFNGGDVIKQKPQASYDRYIVCGSFKLKAEHSVYKKTAQYDVWAKQNNLIYILGNKIVNYSDELELEMVKHN